MKAVYYKNAKDVLFINPIYRFIAKLFGPNIIVVKCKTCGKFQLSYMANFVLTIKYIK